MDCDATLCACLQFPSDCSTDRTAVFARDEGAKVKGLVVPPFEHYKDAVMKSIAYAPCDVTQFAQVGGLAYKRDGNVILAPAFAKASL
jgi:hypothetical protein